MPQVDTQRLIAEIERRLNDSLDYRDCPGHIRKIMEIVREAALRRVEEGGKK